jgi:phosphate transport system substrate-binding protein
MAIVKRGAGSLVFLFLCATLISAADEREIVLHGAGSTFIYPILSRWIKSYRKLHPAVQIDYEPVGSGRGISRCLAGSVDFGASDGPLSDGQIKHAQRSLLHVPVVLGAVVPAYNLPGITEPVRFTPSTLAGIFLGNIKRWDDAGLRQANPGLKLPARDIVTVFRTDGSGTTYVWTDFLSKTNPEWKKRVGLGTSVEFPVGVGAQFNEGIVEVVKQTPYSLGYLQITYAVDQHVQHGLVQNSSGVYVKADSAGITPDAAAVDLPADFRVSITNAGDPDAYPISSYTWLLIPVKVDDPIKRKALLDFLLWVLTEGQKDAAPLHYAPLPGDIALRVAKGLSQLP